MEKNIKTRRTIYTVGKMDCPSEERLIRMKLEGVEGIFNLKFDIPERQLTVHHKSGAIELITKKNGRVKP